MIFDLAQDFHDAVAAMPREHPKRRVLDLLEEAVRRDIHFIDRHPTTFFQCLWNTCWWYDCPEAAKHYEVPAGGWKEAPPWERCEPRLHTLVDRWRAALDASQAGPPWLRSHRPPPVPLASTLKAIFRGHSHAVEQVSFAGDGCRIVSASSDGAVQTWDARNGALLTKQRGGLLRSFNAAGESPPLVMVCQDEVMPRDIGGCLSVIRLPTKHKGPLASSPDGQIIATASDATIRLWSTATGDLVREIHVPPLWYRHAELAVRGVRFSVDGELVASYGHNNISVWRVDSGEQVAMLNPFGSSPSHFERFGIQSMAFHPNGREIVVGLESHGVILWDMVKHSRGAHFPVVPNQDTPLQTLYAHKGWVNDAVVSADGRLIVTGSEDGTVIVWDVDCGNMRAVFEGHERGVTSVAISPDSRWIVSGSKDKTVRMWNVCIDSIHPTLVGHRRPVYSLNGAVVDLCYAPHGRLVASGGQDGSARIWDVLKGTQVTVLKAALTEVRVRFLAGGTRLLTASQTFWRTYDVGQASYCLQLWSIPHGDCLVSIDGPALDEDVSWMLSQDERRLLTWSAGDCGSANEEPVTRVWDTATGNLLQGLPREEFLAEGCGGAGDGGCVSSRPNDQRYRWHLAPDEAAIEDVFTGFVLCNFPATLDPLIESPCVHQWAGAVEGNHLQILTLENHHWHSDSRKLHDLPPRT